MIRNNDVFGIGVIKSILKEFFSSECFCIYDSAILLSLSDVGFHLCVSFSSLVVYL